MQPQRKLVLGQTTTHESFQTRGLTIKNSLPLITVLIPWTVSQHGNRTFFIQFKGLWFGYLNEAVAWSSPACPPLFLCSVVICAFPECSTAAFITAGCCRGAEWDQKMCCFCTNSDVIGIASQTVLTGEPACNWCVGGKQWWVFYLQIYAPLMYIYWDTSLKYHLIRKWQEVTLFWYLISCFCITLISRKSTRSWRDYITDPNSVSACLQNTIRLTIRDMGRCLQCQCLHKWCSVEMQEVLEVGLFFSCSCMLEQFC